MSSDKITKTNSSKQPNYEYDKIKVPNFDEEDWAQFNDAMRDYPFFRPDKDMVLYPFLFLRRMRPPSKEEMYPYDGERCIVKDCKGNDTDEHHEHMYHIYRMITNFLNTSYNLDRISEPLSTYITGVFTILTELLSPVSSAFHKDHADAKLIQETLESLSQQSQKVSDHMITKGFVQYRAKHDDSLITHIKNSDELDRTLKESALVMIDFWADWCGPCHALNPLLKDISYEMKDKIKIIKVNVDDQKEIAKKFKIASMPTMVLYHQNFPHDNGELERIVGVKDKEFLKQRIEFAHKDGFTRERPHQPK